MLGKIKAEWEPLRRVIVHRPGIEMFFGLLDPMDSLYERAFNQTEALKEHDRLVAALHDEFKVDVQRLRDLIIHYAEKDSKAKKLLVDTALSRMEFTGSESEIVLAKKQIESTLDYYDSDYFLNIILLMPKMIIKKSKTRETVDIDINVSQRDPLANLYFMRDQQAVTDKGIFLSRMSKPQRRHEPELTKMLWKMMGIPIAHETTAPGTIEGGEFMPMKEFALIGKGDRTNLQGVEQMLEHGLSFPEVAVVQQPTHPLISSTKQDPMVNMHLDVYFNVAGSDTVIGSEVLFKRAQVEVYHREGDSYKKEKKNTNLLDYIKGKGFRIINLSTLEQLSYAANFLCIKDHTILAIQSDQIVKKTLENINQKASLDKERYGALLLQAKKDYQAFLRSGQVFPHKRELYQNGIDFYAIDLKNITGGYGGAHCMTAVIERG